MSLSRDWRCRPSPTCFRLRSLGDFSGRCSVVKSVGSLQMTPLVLHRRHAAIRCNVRLSPAATAGYGAADASTETYVVS